jgi:DNA-directed RNA polymerase subunit RPC12/RpoP
MNKCIECGKPTDNNIMWSFNNTQSCTPQYVCEKCMWKSINKRKAEYQKKYDKALKYLKDNNYKVIATGYGDFKEIFEIKDDVMGCVDIIREIMKQQGFYEKWIDVD